MQIQTISTILLDVLRVNYTVQISPSKTFMEFLFHSY